MVLSAFGVVIIENCACDATLSVGGGVLTKQKSPKLYQNIPNPFSSTSTIKYFLPHDINSAYMIFTNTVGKIISKINLEDRGEVELNINSDKLPVGVYHNTLIINNKKVDSKRMIIK
ncbi:hypothetical protein [Tenacibaculum jejuense]|uniref:Secretion system C-terminal sorting domain-containing protein n=1 Tax=Tenacibaculum jejuense TaxID=584609 RepID=A0A238U8E4_9FLAO|nr:hypothetical protein [Tenacibaculum jejuense]SNR15463.1 protein of unknown function [Tenacibaculum jejuense]